jgi:hypothetical protein
MLRPIAQFVKTDHCRVRLDNVLSFLYDEFTPPQELDATITTVEGQSAEHLLAEDERLGLDTTPYEFLLTRSSAAGDAYEHRIKKELDRRLIAAKVVDDFVFFVNNVFAASLERSIGSPEIDSGTHLCGRSLNWSPKG